MGKRRVGRQAVNPKVKTTVTAEFIARHRAVLESLGPDQFTCDLIGPRTLRHAPFHAGPATQTAQLHHDLIISPTPRTTIKLRLNGSETMTKPEYN